MRQWSVAIMPKNDTAHIEIQVYNKKAQLCGELCIDVKYIDEKGIVIKKTENS